MEKFIRTTVTAREGYRIDAYAEGEDVLHLAVYQGTELVDAIPHVERLAFGTSFDGICFREWFRSDEWNGVDLEVMVDSFIEKSEYLARIDDEGTHLYSDNAEDLLCAAFTTGWIEPEEMKTEELAWRVSCFKGGVPEAEDELCRRAGLESELKFARCAVIPVLISAAEVLGVEIM